MAGPERRAKRNKIFFVVETTPDQSYINIQCPLDIKTLDKAAALPIAAATRVTDLRHYINSNLGYSNLKLLGLMY